MTDAFNPQEILSRLRAKPTSSGTAQQTNNSTALPNSAPIVTVNTNKDTSSTNGKPAKGALKTPPSLTLTATQRQDNLAARNEFEREIKRLKDEVIALKAENRQLRSDKEEIEKQYIDLKTKSDDTVTKLRGKIAKLSMSMNGHATIEGSGKMYPPQKHVPGHPSKVAKHEAQMMADNEGFRDPTFSELMRRSTQEAPDFKESLRKNPLNASTGSSKTRSPPKQSNSGYGGGLQSELDFVPPPPPPPPIGGRSFNLPSSTKANSQTPGGGYFMPGFDSGPGPVMQPSPQGLGANHFNFAAQHQHHIHHMPPTFGGDFDYNMDSELPMPSSSYHSAGRGAGYLASTSQSAAYADEHIPVVEIDLSK